MTLQWTLMNWALEATHGSEEGLPGGKRQKFSVGWVGSEHFRKAVIEEAAVYLPETSHIPILATQQKTKHSALPKVTQK